MLWISHYCEGDLTLGLIPVDMVLKYYCETETSVYSCVYGMNSCLTVTLRQLYLNQYVLGNNDTPESFKTVLVPVTNLWTAVEYCG